VYFHLLASDFRNVYSVIFVLYNVHVFCYFIDPDLITPQYSSASICDLTRVKNFGLSFNIALFEISEIVDPAILPPIVVRTDSLETALSDR
jgi:hypothetical protein